MTKFILYSDDEREFISESFDEKRNLDKYTRNAYNAKKFNSKNEAEEFAINFLYLESMTVLGVMD